MHTKIFPKSLKRKISQKFKFEFRNNFFDENVQNFLKTFRDDHLFWYGRSEEIK